MCIVLTKKLSLVLCGKCALNVSWYFLTGVNVLPWSSVVTNETVLLPQRREHRKIGGMAQHGIYGAGKNLDETFGLIETAEKAAEIYMKIAAPATDQYY